MDNVTYQIRLPKTLRDEFLILCKENGLTGSGVIKQFMLNYLNDKRVKKSFSNAPINDVEAPKKEFKFKDISYYDENLVQHWVDSDELQKIADNKGWDWLSNNLIRAQIESDNKKAKPIPLSSLSEKPNPLSKNQQKRANKKIRKRR